MLEMSKLTARDLEDLLQVCLLQFKHAMFLMQFKCAIPVFDGLFPPPHDTNIIQLLFDLVHWHGLAKLRMHMDYTLKLLDEATIALGCSLRTFAMKTCSTFNTHELQ